ncbi:MAG: GFA family protein [Pseudomonadota bacterium]
MDQATIKEGGCQCGAVRYRFIGKPVVTYLCHCQECQKQSASAFGISVQVRRKNFEITMGTPKFWQRLASSGRGVLCAFCPDCGSRLYHASNHESENVSIKGGSLDDVSDLKPLGHLWTRSAQPWVKIDRGGTAFAFETEPEDFDEQLAHWAQV